MTINLENRKKIDFNLITKATKRKPRTFTELLHITRLPRKTLCLRLKELCANEVLVKRQRIYGLNGASNFKEETVDSMKRFPRIFRDERIKTSFMLIMLLICFSASGYVLAKFFTPQSSKEVSQEPVIIGTFTMDLNVPNVNDLYAWQVLTMYNSSELTVLEVIPGGFVGAEYPTGNIVDISGGVFMNATDIGNGMLFLGGSLCGNVSGRNGNGRLATIVFGYFTENYDEPKIMSENAFETLLYNSQSQLIPINDSTLTLTMIGKP